MPVLAKYITSPLPDDTETTHPSDSRIWVSVLVVVGSILLVAVFVATILLYFRRRAYREAKNANPSLSHQEFRRWRKMSAADRQKEEEIERRVMIRKSLATRSGEWSTHFDSRSLDIDENDEHGLREDWKEWEARMTRERSDLAYGHPSATTLPDLPIPTKYRSRSAIRSPLLSQQTPSTLCGPPRRMFKPLCQTPCPV